MQNTPAATLYQLLVTRDFEPEILDTAGKPVTNPEEAEIFSFDWKTNNKNYGTVVILLGEDNDLEVYFGDNLGRTMEGDDKGEWYDFLKQIKDFAVRNLMNFNTQNLNRLKYTMQGMAAIKEGLFEGYYGTRRVSYADQPQKTRIVIQHSRPLSEGEARYRNIDAVFVENHAGERFRMRTRKMVEARAQARHVAQGGNPYDAFGQHISTMVEEMMVLSRFRRANHSRIFEGATHGLVEQANQYYESLRRDIQALSTQRGYQKIRESWDPAEITEQETAIDEIKTLFIENTLDSRIEAALPILARLKDNNMREIQEFEQWTDAITEGTWAMPTTPEQQRQLKDLMAQELVVGPDATNAREQLTDIIGDDELFDILHDIADQDPDANAWENPQVIERLSQLGINIPAPTAPPVPASDAQPQPMNEETVKFEPVTPSTLPQEGKIHSGFRLDTSLLPGFRDNSTGEDYSDTYYYRDPISGGVFAVYAHGGAPRIRGTNGMPESRVEEIVQTLSHGVAEDLDADGVMMTRPSNMSSESVENDSINRLIELARI